MIFKDCPENGSPSFPIVVPKPGIALMVYVATEGYLGVPTHWYGNKTIACSGSVENCPACQRNAQPVWKGFVICRGLKSHNPVIVQFSPLCVGTLRQLGNRPQGMVGAIVTFSRAGSRANSPMMCHHKGEQSDAQPLELEVLRRALLRIFAENSHQQLPDDKSTDQKSVLESARDQLARRMQF